MFYIFDNTTGLCICSSPVEVSIDGTTIVEDEQFYNMWEIKLEDGKIKVIPQKPEESKPTDSPVEKQSLIYRIKHGDNVYNEQYPSTRYVATIVSFQMASDTFNSPNVGAVVKKPEIPLYRGADYIVGINSDGIAYCRNNGSSLNDIISGWITVVLNRK